MNNEKLQKAKELKEKINKVMLEVPIEEFNRLVYIAGELTETIMNNLSLIPLSISEELKYNLYLISDQMNKIRISQSKDKSIALMNVEITKDNIDQVKEIIIFAASINKTENYEEEIKSINESKYEDFEGVTVPISDFFMGQHDDEELLKVYEMLEKFNMLPNENILD